MARAPAKNLPGLTWALDLPTSAAGGILERLLLIYMASRADARGWWSGDVGELAIEFGGQPVAARARLADLVGRGLVQQDAAGRVYLRGADTAKA